MWIEITVVAVAPEAAADDARRLEAELGVEHSLWSGELPDSLVTLAHHKSPTVRSLRHRIELGENESVAVTILDRDRRRVRVLVSERGAESGVDDVANREVERVFVLRLNRSYRPAVGRFVAPLERGDRWIRIQLQRR